MTLDSATLGQHQLALVCAACEGVRQILIRVRSPATGAFVGASATGNLVRVFVEVRTLLPALVYLVSTFKGVSACPGALPAFVGQDWYLPTQS